MHCEKFQDYLIVAGMYLRRDERMMNAQARVDSCLAIAKSSLDDSFCAVICIDEATLRYQL